MSRDRCFPYQIELVGTGIRVAWVNVEGSLSVSNLERLEKTFEEIAAEGLNNLVVDVSAVDYLDSSVVSLFLSKFKEVSRVGGMLRLHNPTMRVLKILRFLGFDKTVRLTHDKEDALQSFIYQEENQERLWSGSEND